jgi:hypothetical protein
MSIISNENSDLLFETIFMKKINSHFTTYYDISHISKDNILIGAKNIIALKQYAINNFKMKEFKIQSADTIQVKIDIVEENKTKFLDDDDEGGD